MTAKQYLQQLGTLSKKIEEKKIELKMIQSAVTGLRAVDTTNICVSGGKTATDAGFVDNLIKIQNLQEEINQTILIHITLMDKIINQIHLLENPKYINILFGKYVELKKLDKIAEEMNYNGQYVVEMHGSALRAFEKKCL